jgi:RNA polymerase sigma-70 factor (ECF subfamily)
MSEAAMDVEKSNAGPDSHALWLQEIAKGNRDAFEKLYTEYQKRLFRYFIRMVGSVEAAEELTTDVLVEIWKKAGEFRGLSKVSTWVFGIAHHKAMNRFRTKQIKTEDIESAAQVADANSTPEENAAQENLKGTIKRALTRLSAEHREVMELTFADGLSYQEIAEIMQCPINTVKTRMHYAKRHLEEILSSMGVNRETA